MQRKYAVCIVSNSKYLLFSGKCNFRCYLRCNIKWKSNQSLIKWKMNYATMMLIKLLTSANQSNVTSLGDEAHAELHNPWIHLRRVIVGSTITPV